jgi:hypothetical protein
MTDRRALEREIRNAKSTTWPRDSTPSIADIAVRHIAAARAETLEEGLLIGLHYCQNTAHPKDVMAWHKRALMEPPA